MVPVAKFATTKMSQKARDNNEEEKSRCSYQVYCVKFKTNQCQHRLCTILFMFCNNIKILTIIFSVQMYIFFKWGARPPLITTRSLMVAVWLVRGQPMRPLHTSHHVPTCPPLPATPQPCHPTSPPQLRPHRGPAASPVSAPGLQCHCPAKNNTLVAQPWLPT